MDIHNLKVNDLVRAFHPRELGVVRDGRVVKIGRKYVHVDFGSLRGGIYRVVPAHITGHATDYRNGA